MYIRYILTAQQNPVVGLVPVKHKSKKPNAPTHDVGWKTYINEHRVVNDTLEAIVLNRNDNNNNNNEEIVDDGNDNNQEMKENESDLNRNDNNNNNNEEILSHGNYNDEENAPSNTGFTLEPFPNDSPLLVSYDADINDVSKYLKELKDGQTEMMEQLETLRVGLKPDTKCAKFSVGKITSKTVQEFTRNEGCDLFDLVDYDKEKQLLLLMCKPCALLSKLPKVDPANTIRVTFRCGILMTKEESESLIYFDRAFKSIMDKDFDYYNDKGYVHDEKDKGNLGNDTTIIASDTKGDKKEKENDLKENFECDGKEKDKVNYSDKSGSTCKKSGNKKDSKDKGNVAVDKSGKKLKTKKEMMHIGCGRYYSESFRGADDYLVNEVVKVLKNGTVILEDDDVILLGEGDPINYDKL